MFTINSRYARLPTSRPVNAAGERLLGTNVRLIPPTAGTFLHTVQSRDRLDLLATKYYGDSTRWWQISDANPGLPFPTDLLDRAPIRDEIFSFVNPDSQKRFSNLLASLQTLGESVRFPVMGFSESSLVALSMTPAVRTQTIGAIQSNGFHFIRSFAWSDGITTGEIFCFDHPAAKLNWRLLMEDLGRMPGILQANSAAEDGTMHVVYNTTRITHQRILGLAEMRGYAVVATASQESEQIGAQIVVPPNSVS